jgi:hypothetical protein
LLMALVGLGVVTLAGPIAVVLGLALVGYLTYGLCRLIVLGGPVSFRVVTEEAAHVSRKVVSAIGWVGERVVAALGFVAGLGGRLVRGVIGLGALTLRLATGGVLGGLLGAIVWSFFSFDAVTIIAGGIFGAIVGTVAGLGSRSKQALVVRQSAQSRA